MDISSFKRVTLTIDYILQEQKPMQSFPDIWKVLWGVRIFWSRI